MENIPDEANVVMPEQWNPAEPPEALRTDRVKIGPHLLEVQPLNLKRFGRLLPLIDRIRNSEDPVMVYWLTIELVKVAVVKNLRHAWKLRKAWRDVSREEVMEAYERIVSIWNL